MDAAPAGIPELIWQATHPLVRELVLEQEQQIERNTHQLTALATRVAQLEEQKGRNSRNSSKPPSSDGPGKGGRGGDAGKDKGDGERKRRKRGGQPGHPGHGRNLLPSEQCKEVIPHRPSVCRGCGTALGGDDPEPLRHQVVEIPQVLPVVIEHQLHRLVCPCCSASTTATLADGVETSGYGPRLSALVGVLGGTYHLSHRKVQGLLDQLLGITISTGAINAIRCRLSDALAAPVSEAKDVIRQQAVVHMDETGSPIGNADGNNPEGRRGWLWVLVTPLLSVFEDSLSRSAEVAKQLLGTDFSGILISDRYGAYSWVDEEHRQICWAHLRRDLTAIAQRPGVSGELGLDLLDLEHQLFHQWHRWRADEISREHLQELTDPIRLDFETTLQWASDLGFGRGEKTPWATTVRTCRQILTVAPALWTFLGLSGVEPTNNAAERALRQAVIYRKVCFGVQSAAGGRCLSRLLTVTTSLKQQGRDALEFMVAAWNAHYHGMPAPSLIPQAQ